MRRVPTTILVIMGVSGCGKSTIAALLAARLGWTFVEGDDLHPPANIDKMARGMPLDDADRAPWLAALGQHIDRWSADGIRGVLTCSALKRAYRDQLAAGRPGLRFVYLKGDKALIAARLGRRTGHFMPPDLLDSQFAALEEPTADEAVLTVEIGPAPKELVEQIVEVLRGAI